MSRRSPAFALAAAAAVVALTGCGGSTPPSVASVAATTSSGAAAGSGAPPSQAQLQQGLLRYARCMRAHGVPGFPDPTPGGGFQLAPGSGVDPGSPAFRAAQATCRKLVPGGLGPAPGSATHPSAQWLARMVEVAQCMRRHGVAGFPDPRTSIPADFAGARMISDIDGVVFVFPAAIDTQSPRFVQAAKACGFPLHNH